MNLQIKRVYDEPRDEDGFRVLVDRLWPRGLTKERAKLDLWLKEIAPSTALRKWFDHDPAKWEGFSNRYVDELIANPEPVLKLEQQLRGSSVTLLYGAKDEKHNEAVVLRDYMMSRAGGGNGERQGHKDPKRHREAPSSKHDSRVQDIVDIAGEDSFPASDAPAWTCGREPNRD